MNDDYQGHEGHAEDEDHDEMLDDELALMLAGDVCV